MVTVFRAHNIFPYLFYICVILSKFTKFLVNLLV